MTYRDHRTFETILGGICLSLFNLACDGEGATIVNPDNMGGQTADGDGGTSSGTGGSSGAQSSTGGSGTQQGGASGDANAGGSGGGAPAETEVSVSGEITEDTTWTADKTYLLEGTAPVFVVNNSTLTIEAGTRIVGRGVGTALVVTRGSQLIADGTADAPIVFTSGVVEGLRNAGDWGGVVLLGGAPLNAAGSVIEGIAATDPRGAYGGPAVDEGDAAHNCGTLRYVRIEYAGFQYSVDNELNSLTLGGCGSDTIIDHVQVHRGLDDGIEIFGGTVNIKHVVISNGADDGLDWDRGWVGRGQFIIVRIDENVADGAIEADNNNSDNAAQPRSNPTLFNMTFVGAPDSSSSPAMVFRRGTYATIGNSIFTGFPVGALDIRDAESVTGANAGDLTVTNSIFFENGEGGTAHGETADDGTGVADALDENVWLAVEARANQIDVDPLLPAPPDPEAEDYDPTEPPNFVPPASSPAATAATAALPTGFDAADYIGALPPQGEGDDWTLGWTAYPVR